MRNKKAELVISLMIVFLIPFYSVVLEQFSDIRQYKNDLLKNEMYASALQEMFSAYDIKNKDTSIAFDNYVIQKVMDKVNEKELDKFKVYNNHFSPDFMQSYKTRKADDLKEMSYESVEGMDYIRISTFVDGETYGLFTELMKKANSHILIIDLSDNSGGNFKDAASILDDFIQENELLFQIQGRKRVDRTFSKHAPVYDYEHIYVIVNKGTASVSELFVTSLDSHLDNVTLIGESTYGKSIRATMVSFEDESALMVISGIMKGPNEEMIDDVTGLQVDHTVTSIEEALKTIAVLKDAGN